MPDVIAICRGDWKPIHHLETDEVVLFDLASDQGEQINLAAALLYLAIRQFKSSSPQEVAGSMLTLNRSGSEIAGGEP